MAMLFKKIISFVKNYSKLSKDKELNNALESLNSQESSQEISQRLADLSKSIKIGFMRG